MKAEQVLISPLLTEKTNALRDKENTYVFKISSRANKALVISSIKEVFNVLPLACRIVNVSGKKKRIMARRTPGKAGRTSSWKKAYISLKDGDTLNIFNE